MVFCILATNWYFFIFIVTLHRVFHLHIYLNMKKIQTFLIAYNICCSVQTSLAYDIIFQRKIKKRTNIFLCYLQALMQRSWRDSWRWTVSEELLLAFSMSKYIHWSQCTYLVQMGLYRKTLVVQDWTGKDWGSFPLLQEQLCLGSYCRLPVPSAVRNYLGNLKNNPYCSELTCNKIVLWILFNPSLKLDLKTGQEEKWPQK